MDTEKAVLYRGVSLSASKSNNEDRKMVCRVHSERAEGNSLGALVVTASRPVSLSSAVAVFPEPYLTHWPGVLIIYQMFLPKVCSWVLDEGESDKIEARGDTVWMRWLHRLSVGEEGVKSVFASG